MDAYTLKMTVKNAVKEALAENTLYGSSGSLDGIKKIISDFYMGSTITLSQINENEWSVATKKGLVSGAKVVLKKGRYRFEES